jgi:hypothetical protein
MQQRRSKNQRTMKAGTMVEEQLKGAEELVQLANIKQ